MFIIEIKKLIKVKMWIRRISFIISFFTLSFFVYIGYKGVEYKLTEHGIAVITLVPFLILFTSARWWEGLAGKEFIGLSIKKGRTYKDTGKSGHVVEQEGCMQEIIDF